MFFAPQSEGREVVSWLVAQLANADHHTMPCLLTEVKAVADIYPSILLEHIGEISKYSQTAPVAARVTIQQLKDMCVKTYVKFIMLIKQASLSAANLKISVFCPSQR